MYPNVRFVPIADIHGDEPRPLMANMAIGEALRREAEQSLFR